MVAMLVLVHNKTSFIFDGCLLFVTWNTAIRTDGIIPSRIRPRYSHCFLGDYRGTSLIKKRTPLEPCRRPVPRVLRGSLGSERFLVSEASLYSHCFVGDSIDESVMGHTMTAAWRATRGPRRVRPAPKTACRMYKTAKATIFMATIFKATVF